MSFTKKDMGGEGTQLWVGWNAQLNSKALPQAGNIMQQWVSPFWVKDQPANQAVYYCESSTSGSTTSVKHSTFISSTDLQARTGNAAATTSGLTSIGNESATRVGQWVNPTSEYWGYLECMTWRQQNGDLMNNYKVGDTITMRAGYKVFKDAEDVSPSMSISRFDYSYTMKVPVADFSNYLSLGAAAMAVLGISVL